MPFNQILKIIFLVLIVLLASAIFVCRFLIGKQKNIDVNNKRIRIILRVRMGCFLGILILFFLLVVL